LEAGLIRAAQPTCAGAVRRQRLCLPAAAFRFRPLPPRRFRHSHGAFLLTKVFKRRHQIADMVRHRPAVSGGLNWAAGQEKSQNSGGGEGMGGSAPFLSGF